MYKVCGLPMAAHTLYSIINIGTQVVGAPTGRPDVSHLSNKSHIHVL